MHNDFLLVFFYFTYCRPACIILQVKISSATPIRKVKSKQFSIDFPSRIDYNILTGAIGPVLTYKGVDYYVEKVQNKIYW